MAPKDLLSTRVRRIATVLSLPSVLFHAFFCPLKPAQSWSMTGAKGALKLIRRSAHEKASIQVLSMLGCMAGVSGYNYEGVLSGE